MGGSAVLWLRFIRRPLYTGEGTRPQACAHLETRASSWRALDLEETVIQFELVLSDAPEFKGQRTPPSSRGRRGLSGQNNGCAILGYENQPCLVSAELRAKPSPKLSATPLLAAIRADALVQEGPLDLGQQNKE